MLAGPPSGPEAANGQPGGVCGPIRSLPSQMNCAAAPLPGRPVTPWIGPGTDILKIRLP